MQRPRGRIQEQRQQGLEWSEGGKLVVSSRGDQSRQRQVTHPLWATGKTLAASQSEGRAWEGFEQRRDTV